MNRLLVVIPVKDPAQAKSRLRPALPPAARAELMRRLFLQLIEVLQTLRSAERAFDLAVVTASREMACLARDRGVYVIPEDGTPGLNGALETVKSHAIRGGWQRLCILPADLAAPQADDLARFLDCCAEGDGVALCPSNDLGTNALMVSPPDALEFGYGPGSFMIHYQRASQAGLTPVILPLVSLRRDIDTPDDLALLTGGA